MSDSLTWDRRITEATRIVFSDEPDIPLTAYKAAIEEVASAWAVRPTEKVFPVVSQEDAPVRRKWQYAVMVYDPQDGRGQPYPSEAAQYRAFHGLTAWLYNPWSGKRRDARDVGSDVEGLLIDPETGEPKSAQA